MTQHFQSKGKMYRVEESKPGRVPATLVRACPDGAYWYEPGTKSWVKVRFERCNDGRWKRVRA